MAIPSLTAEQYYRLTLQRIEAAMTAITASLPVLNETPSGAINGVNHVYTTANMFTGNDLWVYYNGQRLSKTDDYTISSANSFTMILAPVSGDSVRVDYVKA